MTSERIVFVVLIILALAALSYCEVGLNETRHREIDLQHHGVAATATVTWKGLGAGRGRHYLIVYNYSPNGRWAYRGVSEVEEEVYNDLSVGQSVPIVYQRGGASYSELNVGNAVRTGDYALRTRNAQILLALLVLIVMPMLLVLNVVSAAYADKPTGSETK